MSRVIQLLCSVTLLAICSAIGFADMTCSCGTIVHSNQPTTCPVCSTQLPIRAVNPRPIHPGRPIGDPHGVNDSSGLKLGVVIYNAGGRVVVERVLPNTPADGHFFPNDQIVKGAFRDAQDGRVYSVPINSPASLTQLKTMAGPGNRVAMRVSRPTSGPRSFFVTFASQGGVVSGGARAYSTQGVAAAAPVAAASVQADTTGEAAGWLDNSTPRAANANQRGNVIQGGSVIPVNPNPGVVNPGVPTPAVPGVDTAEGLLGQ